MTIDFFLLVREKRNQEKGKSFIEFPFLFPLFPFLITIDSFQATLWPPKDSAVGNIFDVQDSETAG